jgi:Flp pilus assembly protein TadG
MFWSRVTGTLARRRRADDRGAAAVEFALTVIPLLMIVFGVIHFGFAMAQKASLNSSVRAGARYGSVNLYNSTADPHSCAKTITRAKDGITTLGMSATAVNFNVYRGADQTAAVAAGPLCTQATSASSPAGLKPPCQGGTDSDNLYVIATYTSSLIGVPFTGISKTINFQSVGAYRCEYTA